MPSTDSIWTYERAEGRRIALPWLWRRSIRRNLQIDIVFAEPLCEGPKLETLDDTLAAWFATRAESLAWKLLWLETDMHPQGKDLYDALLLARHVTLSRALLRRVFAASPEPQWSTKYEEPTFVLDWLVDWENFAKEYPALAGGGVEEQKRLLAGTLVLTP